MSKKGQPDSKASQQMKGNGMTSCATTNSGQEPKQQPQGKNKGGKR